MKKLPTIINLMICSRASRLLGSLADINFTIHKLVFLSLAFNGLEEKNKDIIHKIVMLLTHSFYWLVIWSSTKDTKIESPTSFFKSLLNMPHVNWLSLGEETRLKKFQSQDDEQNWHYRETGITETLTLQKNCHYRKTYTE